MKTTPDPFSYPIETHMGRLVDRDARNYFLDWLDYEGIAEGPGKIIQVNRYLRDPLGTGAYRIPDIRIPDAHLILDATLGTKRTTTPQVIDFFNFSGSDNILIVRPTPLGGSTGLMFP